MAYNFLDKNFNSIGVLTNTGGQLNNYWGDQITHSIATSNDVLTSVSLSIDKATKNIDTNGNQKEWNHTIQGLSFGIDGIGKNVDELNYVVYQDGDQGHYYLMTITQVDESLTTSGFHFKTIQGINSAAYDLSRKTLKPADFAIVPTGTQKTGSAQNILKYIFSDLGWDVRVIGNFPSIDYTITDSVSAQSVLQDVIKLFDAEVDAHVLINNISSGSNVFTGAGSIKRVFEFSTAIGNDNGDVVRLNRNLVSLTKTGARDSLYTKLYVTGNEIDIAPANNGANFIYDDNANRKYNSIGANSTPVQYLEGVINNSEIKNPQALLTWGKKQLKALNHPRYNYIVTSINGKNVHLGDDVVVQDLKASQPIILKSKIISKTISFADPQTDSFILGEFSPIVIPTKNNDSNNIVQLVNKANQVATEALNKSENTQKGLSDLTDTVDKVQEQATQAVVSANGKNSNYYGSVEPSHPKEGDTWFWNDGTNSGIKVFTNGKWVDSVDTKTLERINNAVDGAIENSKTYTDELNEKQVQNTNTLNDKVDKSVKALTDSQKNLASQASAYTDSAVADANAKAVEIGQTTAQNAQKALEDKATTLQQSIETKVAKTDYNQKTGELTTSVNTAQQTADTATQTIGTYTETNDKRVSAAETNIQKNADAIKSTVSKTDFDEKTGKLIGDISSLEQRADGFDATVTKVDNLAVGGRNLLQETGTASGDVSNGGGTFVKSAFNGYDAVKTNNDFSGRYINLKSALGRTNAKAGDWYTISVYVKADKQIDTGSLTVYRARGNGDANTNDGHLNGIQMQAKPITTQWQQYSWSFQINDISLQRQSTRVESYNTGDNWIYWAGWKLERGNLVTDWTPAPEDVDTQLAQVKITADGVYQTINDPKTGLNTRVSTVEGNYNRIQNDVSGMSNTVTETADGLTREIADRKTGDSNTLQAGKDFTTSQITSYDTGMQSRLTQVSEGIMAQVSSTNLITDSSFVNATSNWTLAGDVSWKINNEIMRKGVRVATFDNGSTNFDRKTATLTSTPIYTMNLGGTQFYASIDIYAQSFGSSAYMKAEIVQKNSSGTTTKTTAIGGSFDTAMTDWNTYTADITLDPATIQLYLQVTQYGGGKVSIARPYLGSVKLNVGDYIPGASTDNTSTLKLFNNFFAFGIQENTGALISGINGDSSGLNIVGKKITVSGDTTFIGKNFMDGAIIKNASIGEAQIADASITNAKISNLDVNKLSGNFSNFIQSNWNGRFGATTIDANGMTVDTSGIKTKFGSSGMTLNMTGESVGGIGVQGLTGKPSDYQGLTFWLDGNAEYMAWGARNNGATSGNPVLKLSWFRNTSAPSGSYAGFNFDDDVYFGQGINVQGASTQKLKFGTQNFNNYNYPYFGNQNNQAGFAFGGVATYLIVGTTYYNMSKVIEGLAGLGAVKIPTAINSDGTVKTWANVTL